MSEKPDISLDAPRGSLRPHKKPAAAPPLDSLSPACFLSALVDGEEKVFESPADKFSELARVWKDYNGGRGVVEFNHAAYMQIIGMGTPVVPILLGRIADGDGDWLVALKYITGAKVTTPEMRGNFRAIRDAWLAWGTEHGFRS